MPRFLRVFPALPRLATRPLLPVARHLTSTSPINLPQASRFSFSFFRPFSQTRTRLTSSPPPSPSSPEVPNTLSGRLKVLIKTYGWYALGVYIVFSTLDFGIAFAAVNLLGADQVSSMATSAKAFVFDLIGWKQGDSDKPDEQTTGGSEGMYAMLVLAYTVHKTLFLPVRVGLTAAFTPRFVGWLGKRGWTGTEGARRASREIRDRVKRGSRESNSP